MGKSSDYNKNVKIIDISSTQTNAFLVALGVKSISAAGYNMFTNNKTYKLNGHKYTLENTGTTDHATDVELKYSPTYNLYDLIAMAKTAKVSNTDIAVALQTAGIRIPQHLNPHSTSRNPQTDWTGKDVATLNRTMTDSAEKIQQWLDNNYSDFNARVSVIANPTGDSYTYRIVYDDPKTGNELVYKLDAPSDGVNYDNTELTSDVFSETQSPIANALAQSRNYVDNNTANNTANNKANTNVEANLNANTLAQQSLANNLSTILKGPTQAEIDKANSDISNANGASQALAGPVGSTAKTNRTITASDIAAIKAALPGTNDLTAWNLINQYGIHNVVSGNIPKDATQLIERQDLDALQKIAGEIDKENQDTTLRNIDQQRKQLLQQIQRDPELYKAITEQFRNDASANGIAGQRAARVADVVKEKNLEYKSAADELYNSLTSGENNVAANTRQSIMGNSTNALDAFIKGQLNNINKAGMDKQTQATDVETAVNALKTMLGVEETQYSDAAAIAQAEADANTEELINKATSETNDQITADDTALETIANIYGIGKDYLKSAVNGDANVADAVNTIISAVKNIETSKPTYTTVEAPEAEEAVKLNNGEYARLQTLLTGDSGYANILNNMDELTETPTLQTLLQDYGLDTLLNERDMKEEYEEYAKNANQQSDRVFNEAQRAYIAAITAGDSKTAASLEKLAQNAGASKRNLYVASALANQYQQQTNALNTGSRLNTDVLNQRSANASAIAQAKLAASQALTNYIGNGTNSYDRGTLYGAAKLFDNAAAQNRYNLASLGNQQMTTTQGLNTTNTNVAIGNNNRLDKLASSYTANNAAAATNNKKNEGTRDTLIAEVEALRKQAEQTLKSRP